MNRIVLTAQSHQALTLIRNEQDATGGNYVPIKRYIELKTGKPPTTNMQQQSAMGYLSRLVGAGYLEFEFDGDSLKMYKITRSGRTALSEPEDRRQ